MRQMKDSGIEWIDEIPQEWDVRRIKFTLDEHSGGSWGTNEGEGEIDCICVRVADFNYPKLSVDFHDKMTVRSYAKKAIEEGCIKSGDILLEKSGGGDITPVGRSVLFESNEQMMCANFIEWLRPNQCFNARFLNYWLAAAYANGFSKRNVKQTTGIQNLDVPAFLSERMAAPVVDVQEAIADFLDSKCAEIDALIAAKEKTNALLRERRQSIIYEVVTKGLNPNAPMKDSGIEWIGMIPEDWGTRKIKYCFEVYAGTTPKSGNSEFWDGDIIWVTPADYTTEQKYISAGRKNITQEGFESCSTELIPAGSLIFSKRAPIGLVAINTVDMCTNQGCLSCVPTANNDVEYFYYAFSCFTEQFDLYGSGTTFKEISADAFMNFIIPYPAPEVQRQISDYLRGKCAEMDTLISANEATIQKLKEYRQSIIYEAVTGKIEV